MGVSSLCIRLFGPLELLLKHESVEPNSVPNRRHARDGALPAAPSSPKAQSLLAYLILHHDWRIPRHQLLGLFWPERAETRGRRALSNTLWQIRQALGPAADRLETEGDTVAFPMRAGDWLDVDVFRKKLDKHTSPNPDGTLAPHRPVPLSSDLLELSAAVELYRADFLDTCYDDWALIEREQLRELYLRALERLITLHKQRGAYDEALTYAQRLVAVDPLRELAHRELMRLYHLLKRPRAALKQFDVLRGHLDKELGVEPSAATVALYHEITASLKEAEPAYLPLAASPPPLLRRLAHLPFVGRSAERTVLVDALQAALQNHGGVALIEGDAGVGKTRLVEETVAGARWRGFQAGLGKADPLSASIPYRLLLDALSPLLTPLRVAQLAELIEPLWLSAVEPYLPPISEQLPNLPPLPDLSAQKEHRRLLEGLSRCLHGLASVAPLLVALEDIHWADEATLTAIPYLARRLPSSRALILLTYRPAEARQRATVWETMNALDRGVPLLRIHLSPFGRSEATTLVRRALGVRETDAAASTFAQRLQDEVGRNALFLVETLKSLLERGDLAPANGLPSEGSPSYTSWRFPSEDLRLSTPPSVQELIRQRVIRLPSELRGALELAAVLGEDADVPMLAHAGDIRLDTLLAAMDELGQRGFLIEAERRYRFGHDHIREIVYQTIALERRTELHRQAGTALETLRPGQTEALAYHFSRGEVWDKAAVYSQQAGDRARMAHANEDAAAHYSRALRALERQPERATPARRFELLLAREAVRGLEGKREEQAHDLESLAALAEGMKDNVRRATAALRQASYHDVTSNYAAATALAQSAVKWAAQARDPALEARGHLALGRAMWLQGDHTSAQAAYGRALALAREVGDQHGEADCLQNLGVTHYDLNEYSAARGYLERALAIRRALGDRYGEAQSLNALGNVYSDVGEHLAARDTYRQSLTVKRAIGDRRGEAHTLYNLSVHYRDLGDGETARQYCEEALAVAEEIDDRRLEAYVLTYLGLILEGVHRPEPPSEADLTAAAEHYARALTIRRQIGQLTLAIDCLAGLARVALAQGRIGDAVARSDEALAWIAEHGPAGIGDVQLVYLSAYRALRADGQDVRAKMVLSAAHDLLMKWAADLDDETARRSLLEDVWPNPEITAAYQAMAGDAHLRQICVRVPVADAPTGRPLTEEEYVDVSWTVSAPEDHEISDRIGRRRHRILRLLREAADQSAAPTLDDLADALDVSVSTIKRDLAALREAGHEVHTRGSRHP